jgi:hypothetical protein
MIKFFKGLEASLPASGVNGALYITTDEGAIYLGTGTGMKRLGDFVQIADVASLPTKAHESCLYYCVAENILAKWNGTEWKQINKQPTAEEMKTLLGLGSLAYKSEVAEGDLNADLKAKIDASTAVNHSHDNKTVLDGITAEKVTAWDGAEAAAKAHADGLNTAMNTRVEALEAIDHEHANKALLDTYTQTEADLADAVAKKHSHTFVESELNKIVDGDVAKWNAAEKNAKDYADGLDGAMNTRVEALETAVGENGSVAAKIKTAIEALDFTDVAVDGEYVSAVNEVDGKISVTRKALPDYSNTYDAKGAADTAFENAKAYADGLAANYDEKGAAAGVKTELEAEIAKKVDKVDGKSLVSDTEITKLAGVSEGANKVEASTNNGSIKIDGVETVVYTHPASHTVSEISDFDEKVKAYDYATKTEAQAMADGKDEAIAAAKKAGDDAQDAIDAYIESNNTALAGVKATADAAAVKTEVETALADRYTKSEADGKFAVKGEDSYDDTALAGRVTTAEGKITALETESAKHALKTELEAVDAKFEDYTKTADLPTDLGDFTNNAGYAKTADVSTELDKKADKTKVATDIANAIAPLATTEALNGVKATAEAATTVEEVDAQIDAKITALNLGATYEPIGAEDRAKAYVDGKFTDANLDQYTTEAEVKSIVDGVIASAADSETYNSLTKLVDYIDTHGGEASEMAQAIETLEGDVKGLKEAPSAGIKASDIEAWNGEIGAKALAETKTTAEEVKAQIEAYGYATTGELATEKSEREAVDAELSAAIDTAKTDAANQDAVVLAESQKYTDSAIATVESKVTELSGNTYSKEETFTKDEVSAAIATAVEEAQTWGSF